MISRLYLRIHDSIVRLRFLLLGLIVVAVGLSVPAVLQLQLNMGFRPLFASNDEVADATGEFEAVFGEASGAHIGVVLEGDPVLSLPFLRELERLSAWVEQMDGVIQVNSLTRAVFPEWQRGETIVRPLLPKGWERWQQLPGDWAETVVQHPGIRRVLLSADGRRTLLLARLGAPLSDLKGRREVIREFRSTVAAHAPRNANPRLVGVSVVEEGYSRIVPRSLFLSVAVTLACILVVLFLVFRSVLGVMAAMAGASIATPVTLALMQKIGQEITLFNSMVPTMVLIIGVADAIHMVQAFRRRRVMGIPRAAAVKGMFGEMGLPCLMTTVTTAIGFLSLQVAHITAIRDFGVNVAIGVVLVYLANLVLVPLLLRMLPDGFQSHRAVGRGMLGVAGFVQSARWLVVLAAIAVLAACGAALPDLSVDQRFNEDVDPDHPLRADQFLLEREFSGYLGPEISIRRRDRAGLMTAEALGRLDAFVRAVKEQPEVMRMRSVLDFLPPGGTPASLETLRKDSRTAPSIREVIDPEGTWTSVIVRIGDHGTRRAANFVGRLSTLAKRHFGNDYQVETVGQWWLAQRGMAHILRDMLASFATCLAFVLPLLALVLRRWRLFLVGILPNMLPMACALGFMTLAGISVRIGTAMILAIALGIAIDDTIHMMVRLREETISGRSPWDATRSAVRKAGGAILVTSVVLIVGFLSMLFSDLVALRDMGLVAAVTLTVALLADVCLAPALFLLFYGAKRSPR